ncbi:MAG TPA: hypothetical protein VGO48_02425 [Conexibacter sp.]|jgi:hypothetical protein|nr:hypothetical protein [Conexibacter sp.]
MGFTRRALEGAFSKLEQAVERLNTDDLSKLTPAERERYDAWVARTEAINAGRTVEELGDPRLIGRVLHGPAGEYVAGITKLDKRRETIEDPAAWEQQMRAERAERDAVRAPYLAPDRCPVRIARVATRGKTQVEEVADRLAADGLAGRPDLIYGVYRVPDLISPGQMGGEGRGVVEWDIVHAAEQELPPAAPPVVATLAADDVLVARRVGEPAPLDEDLALHLLASAGVGPERTLGIARAVAIEKRDGSGDDSSMRILASVRGVHVLAAADSPPLDVAGAPLRIGAAPPEGVVVDVLQWDCIAKAIHPVRQHRPPLPSPFPYLPLTPQELLRAYLEIAGVSPADAYAAQVTHGRPFDLMGRTSMRAGVRRTGGGPDLPCADGEPRQRMAGGHHVVVAYRDRPAYADGRARFDAYAETELKANLRRGLDLRLPVPKPTGRLERTADRVSDVVDFFTGDMGVEDGFVPPRYCWPPQP